MDSQFTVVVEVNTITTPSDWAELSRLARSYVRVQASRRLARGHCPPFLPGSLISLAEAPALVTEMIRTLRVCDVSFPTECRWANLEEVDFVMRVYALCDDAAGSEQDPLSGTSVRLTTGSSSNNDEADVPAFSVTQLPHASLEGQWESLYYGETEAASLLFKRDVVSYVDTAMRFARAEVSPHFIAWNRFLLFYGPPGTGKTSLCRALAQKLSLRLSTCGYPRACLIDINAHSLFSRWYSESGKQVLHLFEQIHQIARDSSCFVCCVMDEVESLAAARSSAMKGNEPSDSIRVVNALLTQIDRLQRRPNILVLATSNLTDAIDEALLDRADKRIYVGPPGWHARYVMLQASVQELIQKGLLAELGMEEASEISIDGGVDVDVSAHAPQPSSAGGTEEANDRVNATVSQTGFDAAAEADGAEVGLRDEEARPETPPPSRSRHGGPAQAEPAVTAETAEEPHRPSRGSRRGQPCVLSALIRHIAEVSDGLNGRTMKKLPFLAYGMCLSSSDGCVKNGGLVKLAKFMQALFIAARKAVVETTHKMAQQETRRVSATRR